MLRIGQQVIHARTGGLDTITGIKTKEFLDSETKQYQPGFELEHHGKVVPERMLIEVPSEPPDIQEGDRVFIIRDTKYGTVVRIRLDDNLFEVLLDPDYQGHQSHLTGNTVTNLRSELVILPRGIGRPTGVLWPNKKRDLFSR